jgi:hypothetical protein
MGAGARLPDLEKKHECLAWPRSESVAVDNAIPSNIEKLRKNMVVQRKHRGIEQRKAGIPVSKL